MTELAIVALLNALAFWQKSDILWLLMVPVNSVFGLQWALTGDIGSSRWVEGIVIVVLGGYCLGRVVSSLLRAKVNK